MARETDSVLPRRFADIPGFKKKKGGKEKKGTKVQKIKEEKEIKMGEKWEGEVG